MRISQILFKTNFKLVNQIYNPHFYLTFCEPHPVKIYLPKFLHLNIFSDCDNCQVIKARVWMNTMPRKLQRKCLFENLSFLIFWERKVRRLSMSMYKHNLEETSEQQALGKRKCTFDFSQHFISSLSGSISIFSKGTVILANVRRTQDNIIVSLYSIRTARKQKFLKIRAPYHR